MLEETFPAVAVPSLPDRHSGRSPNPAIPQPPHHLKQPGNIQTSAVPVNTIPKLQGKVTAREQEELSSSHTSACEVQ